MRVCGEGVVRRCDGEDVMVRRCDGEEMGW